MTRTGFPARAVGTLKPGTDAWLASRARRVGGSEIAAVLGLSPWESRFSLWHRKQSLIPPVDTNEPMLWGNLLEPVVADYFADQHPEFIVATAPTYVHRERDYQTCAPDRLCHDADTARPVAIYEGKTARSGDHWGEPGTDQIPVHYRAQCLWYLDCLDLRVCHLAVLIAGSDYREYVIHYDQAEAQLMRDAAAEFIRSIDAGERPSIDEHTATYEAVRALHPDIEPTSVDVDDATATRFLTACAAEADARDEKRRAAALLLDAMGTAQHAFHGGRRIASRQAKGTDTTPYLVAARGAADHLRSAA